MTNPKRPRATALVEWTHGGHSGLLVFPDANGTWLLPGGGIEPGEQPLAAVARELQEEAGLVAHAAVLLFHYESAFNRHHVFLVRAAGALAILDPREIPAIGLATPDGGVLPLLGAPGRAAGAGPSSTTQAIIQRYRAVQWQRPSLFGALAELSGPVSAAV